MAEDVSEQELLRSIEEVDARIRRFRRRVRALLADIQGERTPVVPAKEAGAAS
jgi:hypothetical protein